MLQIHGIFNPVATLFETRLLQSKISSWDVLFYIYNHVITTNMCITYYIPFLRVLGTVGISN